MVSQNTLQTEEALSPRMEIRMKELISQQSRQSKQQGNLFVLDNNREFTANNSHKASKLQHSSITEANSSLQSELTRGNDTALRDMPPEEQMNTSTQADINQSENFLHVKPEQRVKYVRRVGKLDFWKAKNAEKIGANIISQYSQDYPTLTAILGNKQRAKTRPKEKPEATKTPGPAVSEEH